MRKYVMLHHFRQTPKQLFIAGALRLRLAGLTALDFFENITDEYGIEEDGIAVHDDSVDSVNVPRTTIEAELDHLNQAIDPLAECQNYGIGIYLQVIDFLDTL